MNDIFLAQRIKINQSGRSEYFKAFLKKLYNYIFSSNLNIAHVEETGNMVYYQRSQCYLPFTQTTGITYD